jgi:hypothetical protein
MAESVSASGRFDARRHVRHAIAEGYADVGGGPCEPIYPVHDEPLDEMKHIVLAGSRTAPHSRVDDAGAR